MDRTRLCQFKLFGGPRLNAASSVPAGSRTVIADASEQPHDGQDKENRSEHAVKAEARSAKKQKDDDDDK